MWFTDHHQSAGLHKQDSAKGSGTLHLVVSAFTASANQSFQRGDGVDARIRDLQTTPSGKCVRDGEQLRNYRQRRVGTDLRCGA